MTPPPILTEYIHGMRRHKYKHARLCVEWHLGVRPQGSGQPKLLLVCVLHSAASMPKLVKPKYKHRHACPQCDYKTGKANELRQHVRTVHEKRKDHACPQCDAAFGEAGTLRTHVRTVHEKREEEELLLFIRMSSA